MDILEKEKTNYITSMLSGIVISFLITIIMIFILSLLLCKTDLNENIINPYIIFTSSFSILLGAFFSTHKIEKNGILLGGILGFIYIFTIYIISSIANSNFILNLDSVILIICSIIFGAIGGIIGVNMK